MEISSEVNLQSICKEIIALDSKVLYSSCLDSEGRKVAEATKTLIELYDDLMIMMLPLTDKGALVLAAPSGSDLTDIVTKARNLLPSIPNLTEISEFHTTETLSSFTRQR